MVSGIVSFSFFIELVISESVIEAAVSFFIELVILFFHSNFLGEWGGLPVRAKPHEPVYAYVYMKGPNINQFWAKYQPPNFLLE